MKKPNFVLIVADDMGFSDAGCYGGEISTPNLDALAQSGLRFTQHYSTGRCWPSRACLLTGYYYQQVPKVSEAGRMPDWGRPLPHYLRPFGYRCYHSGKWHVNQFPKPVAHGAFHRSYYIRDYNRNFAVKEHSLHDRPLPPVEPGAGYYSTTAIADYAVDFLKQHHRNHARSPFFLYLAFIVPHFPLHAPAEDIACYRGKYDRGWDKVRDERIKRLSEMDLTACKLPPRQPKTKPRWNLSPKALAERIGSGEAARAVSWRSLTAEQRAFQAGKMEIHAAMIHRMDREIGKVLEQVKAMGEFENTVVLFVSDNGASAEQIIRGDGHDKKAAPGSSASFLCLGPGWSTASNTPFRYHKSWVHEGGVASPLIVHWPAGLPGKHGELRHAPSHFVDLVPTMLELAGANARPDWRGKNSPPLAGISLAPALRGDRDSERRSIFFRHIGHRALRIGKWKLVAVRHGKWELYNMSADRSELRNQASKHPRKVKRMAALWERLHQAFVRQAGEQRD